MKSYLALIALLVALVAAPAEAGCGKAKAKFIRAEASYSACTPAPAVFAVTTVKTKTRYFAAPAYAAPTYYAAPQYYPAAPIVQGCASGTCR